MIQWIRLVTGLGLAVLLASASGLQAEPMRAKLEFGLSINSNSASSADAAFGFQDRESRAASLRLMWQGSTGPFQYEAQAILSYDAGDNVAYMAALAPLLPPAPPATLFDLTRSFTSTANTNLVGRIERLSLGYSSGNLVLRAGRQAVTWGSGMVFHPTDIVAPFSPDAIDTSYKPGVDMLYLQYLFDSGADVQLIAVPRPAVAGGPVVADASTLAARGTLFLGTLDGSYMLARDRGDTVLAAGLSGPLGGAAWNIEYANWQLNGGGQRATLVANILATGSLGERNITYFAEYFRNGFGVAGNVPLDALPPELVGRLATGNLFNTGRDLFALGARLELTPDLILSPGALISLNDSSALLSLNASWTIDDNTDLQLGFRHPLGPDGTEFGGRETSAGSGIFLRPASEISLTLTRFF